LEAEPKQLGNHSTQESPTSAGSALALVVFLTPEDPGSVLSLLGPLIQQAAMHNDISLILVRHSGLDPESRILMDSRFRGNDIRGWDLRIAAGSERSMMAGNSKEMAAFFRLLLPAGFLLLTEF
jgi:hypothetical protein